MGFWATSARSGTNDTILHKYSRSIDKNSDENKTDKESPISEQDRKRFDEFYRKINYIMNGKVKGDSIFDSFRTGLRARELENVLDEALACAMRELADETANGSLYADIIMNCAYHEEPNIRLAARSRIEKLHKTYPGPTTAMALETMLLYDKHLAPQPEVTKPESEKKQDPEKSGPSVEKTDNIAREEPPKKSPVTQEKILIPGESGGKVRKYFPFNGAVHKLDTSIIPSEYFLEIALNGALIQLELLRKLPDGVQKKDLAHLQKYDREAWEACRRLIKEYQSALEQIKITVLNQSKDDNCSGLDIHISEYKSVCLMEAGPNEQNNLPQE